MVKHLPAMRETQVRFLGREDPLEKEMAIHSSTLAWKIPRTEEPDRLQSKGSQRVRHDWVTSLLQIHSSNHFKSDARKDWRKKGTTEDEMVVWHHWLSGHEFEPALGLGDEQEGLACCSSWGYKQLVWLGDLTELNWHDIDSWKPVLKGSKREWSMWNWRTQVWT